MSDFAEYAPSLLSSGDGGTGALVVIRAASAGDVGGLAAVMTSRGGVPEDHLEGARRLLERLPVLLVAEFESNLVGWSGAQMWQVRPDREPEWLISGLTVVPEQRRRGIATRLLRGVLQAVRGLAPEEPVLSIVNAGNLASIDLHTGLGFTEVERGSTFAGVTFDGGEGVLLRNAALQPPS